MPIYVYIDDETGEVEEVFQSMNDEHVFSKNGREWRRIFTHVYAAIDTEIDPRSSRDFVEKTGKKKGTYGDLLDTSKELSQKREQKDGIDNVKQKAYDDYAKKRNGKRPLDEIREKVKKITI